MSDEKTSTTVEKSETKTKTGGFFDQPVKDDAGEFVKETTTTSETTEKSDD